jgi:site-specific DNA-methyltransferase (adenine-specific)
MSSSPAPRKPRKARASKPYPVRDEDDFPGLNSSNGPALSLSKGDPFASLILREDALSPLHLAYRDDPRGVWLYQGDCLEILDALNAKFPAGRFDAIFADPPYFLSNGGITCHAGRMVRVDKGAWDKSRGAEVNHEFNRAWLERCQRALKPNGTLWVTGTSHVIFSIGYAMQQLGFKILNDIVWEKPNPPPNLSCRYFTHSTETVLWAAKNTESKHAFNYAHMREINGGKQMKSVWRFTAPGADEKTHGKHPTQKPVSLVERCLLASTNPGDLVLDPFIGSGTTAIAAMRTQRKCVGIEMEIIYLQLASIRLNGNFPQFSFSYTITVSKEIDLDLLTELIDPSGKMTPTVQSKDFDQVFHETKFVFLNCSQTKAGSVVHTTVETTIGEAWAKAPASPKRETTHIIRCETEIFQVKQGLMR